MNTSMKLVLIVALLVIVAGCGIFFLGNVFSNPNNSGNNKPPLTQSTITPEVPEMDLPHFTRITPPFYINATIFQGSRTLPVYHGVLGKNESLDLQFQQIGKSRRNVTTVQEAPEVAKRVLQPYGGVPEDAIYGGASISYANYYVNSTLVNRVPEFITVSYSRKINGLPLLGDTNSIILTLGTDGELLWIFKIWRNYTYIGDVPLISVDAAIDKLEREELVDSSWHPEEGTITIDTIGQGYYAKKIGNSETILEPLWLFFGTGSSGTRLGFYVYARQFANFTATPTIASVSEEITFRDRSSSIRRIWDFGDGTNTTLLNPIHIYQKPGNYTINLTVWNDLGSDSVSRHNYISILPTGTSYSLSRQSGSTTQSENISGRQGK